MTNHMRFSLEDWLARLAALVPRQRAHLRRYHRGFAPNCRRRAHVAPSVRGAASRILSTGSAKTRPPRRTRRR